MRVRRGFGGAAAAAAGLALAAGAPLPARAAGSLDLTQAEDRGFPERSFVLSLPRARALRARDLRVLENGQRVRAVRVEPANARADFKIVLAIDASLTMRGEPIERAMEAARSFAARRPPKQALGVVIFSRDPRVALAPTTDKAAIDRTLAETPRLSKGTHLRDATASAVDLLRRSDASAGSVVVLSDGADVGSTQTAAELGTAARRAHVRVFSVGLRSRSYDGSTLRELAAATGGRYADATASGLERTFDQIAQRLANEHLLRYTSPSPLGSQVAVEAAVIGVDGTARADYVAPTVSTPAGRRPSATWWTTSAAVIVVVVLFALLLTLALYLVLRPRQVPLEQRIAAFAPPMSAPDPVSGGVDARQAMSMLASAERSLARMRWWPAFVEDAGVARLSMRPMHLALLTVACALLIFWVLAGAAGRPMVGILALVGLPLTVRKYIGIRAARQRREFSDQLVDNLQVIVSAMRAGHSFVGALSVAVEDAAEPARSELRRAVQDEHLGMPIEDAIYNVARRMRNSELEHVGLVAGLQRETGGNTAEVVDRLIDNVRHRTDLKRLVRTLTAQGRIGGAVVTALPVGVTVVMNIISPGFSQPMLDSPTGRLVLLAAAGMVAAGWFLIRRFVDIKV